MKFTLTYEGELRSNDDFRRKWAIRASLHPQLEELWRVHPSLMGVLQRRLIPKAGGFFHVEAHHSAQAAPDLVKGRATTEENMDLLEPIVVGGREFFPLVRDSLALQCGLKITFLRKEEPGRIYQGGDMDNRLKTLFDALSVPDPGQIVQDGEPRTDPIFCLMENDRMISSLTVETHRLLGRDRASRHAVYLMIEVDVRVTQARMYNQAFLG